MADERNLSVAALGQALHGAMYIVAALVDDFESGSASFSPLRRLQRGDQIMTASVDRQHVDAGFEQVGRNAAQQGGTVKIAASPVQKDDCVDGELPLLGRGALQPAVQFNAIARGELQEFHASSTRIDETPIRRPYRTGSR